MRLIGTESGRGVQLVVPDEVRPKHGQDAPVLYNLLAQRYGFAKTPDIQDMFSKGITVAKYEHGRFSAPDFPVGLPIAALDFYTDGIIATCADTEVVDLLIDDCLEWLIEREFIRPAITKIPRTYFSNLVIQFDQISSEKINSAFKTADRFNSALNEQYGWDYRTPLGRLQFSADPRDLPQHRTAMFYIERRAGISYDQNWFFSSAPLPTSSHLRLLEGMERDLMDI
jgi:hypothetical protein